MSNSQMDACAVCFWAGGGATAQRFETARTTRAHEQQVDDG